MKTAKENYLDNPNYLRIFATDLRDGRQGRREDGRKMSIPEAIRVAQALNTLKVDIAEVGFPANSADAELIAAVLPHLTHPTVAVFARDGVPQEIDLAFESIRDLVIKENRGRIALLTKTGERVSSGLSSETIMDRMSEGTRQVARRFNEAGQPLDLYNYWEGASEAPVEFLVELMAESMRVIREEMSSALLERTDVTYGICDTNGSARRGKFGKMISDTDTLIRILGNLDDYEGPFPILAVHAHNDMGLALSNSLEAIDAGARQVDGCINGNGERYGNVDLISVIGNIYHDNPKNIEEERVRAVLKNPSVRPLQIGADVSKSFEVSRKIARAFGEDTSFRRPFVGLVNGATVAGMHNAEETKEGGAFAFKTVDPRKFGVPEEGAVMGDLMGSAGVIRYLEERNISIPKRAATIISSVYSQVGGHMEEDEFMRRFMVLPEVEAFLTPHLQLTSAQWSGVASDMERDSMVRLGFKTRNREDAIDGRSEKGNIAAAMNALKKITNKEIEIVDFSQEALAANGGDVGADAEVIVRVTVRWNGETRVGYSKDPQSTEAGIRALFNAVNSFSFWTETENR